MKKVIVYAVESGAYSDYAVHALFADEADAARAAEKVGGDIVAREVYQSYPEATAYYVVERTWVWSGARQVVAPNAGEMRTHVIEAWDGPVWEGRMVRGVAVSKWSQQGRPAIRVWGTDKEGVRRRFMELTQEQEAEEAGLK